MTLLARLSSKIRADQVTGCWNWTASTQGPDPDHQYGQIRMGGRESKVGLAHRVVYELVIGQIPAGLDLDHLCRNTRCVNPAHLEPVTHRENILRGIAPAAINARKTHCVAGHELALDNLIVRDGHRHCRACRNSPEQRTRSLAAARKKYHAAKASSKAA